MEDIEINNSKEDLKRFEYKYIKIYTKNTVDRNFEEFDYVRYHNAITLYIKFIEFLNWKQRLIHLFKCRTRRLFVSLFVKDKFKGFKEYIKESNDIMFHKETFKYRTKEDGAI